MTISSINPATGDLLREYDALSEDAILRKVDRAEGAFRDWSGAPVAERAELTRRVSSVLRDRVEEYARLMALEMGKPLAQGRAEVNKCARLCDYYADNAPGFLEPEPIPVDEADSRVVFRPLGVILGIMPWNFPFWQVLRFSVPTLAAGNTALLKHASNVPGCALAIEDAYRSAGFPDHVFQTLLISGSRAEELVSHPLVRGVSLTGSIGAGRAVAGRAGERMKKSVLELGGSDPYVILEDADMARAVETCVTSRLINSGQSCIAAKRFIVVTSRIDEFTNRFVELLRHKKVGDPLDEDSDIGPLAREDLVQELGEQVTKSVDRGASVLYRGNTPGDKGFYHPPAVLGNVEPGMPAFDEELFGPVAAVIEARDEADAIAKANGTFFGLGAAVFTRDTDRGRRIAERELEAGSCFVNDFVRSDPRLPFGGVRESGYGRELSRFGIREFVNVKTVYVSGAGGPR